MAGWFDAGRIRIRLDGWPIGPCRPLFCDWTDREPVVAVAVAPEDTAGTEEDGPRVVRVARMEGRRPVVADGPGIEKARVVPVACGWKEDGLAVGARDESSVYSVLGCPGPGAFVY